MSADAEPAPLPLSIRRLEDASVAAAEARRFALQAGLGSQRAGEFAIVASELATNLVCHGGGGELILTASQTFVEAAARDRGPGMARPETLLLGRPPPALPAVGELLQKSLGQGGAAIRRLSDDVTVINRQGGGLEVVARKRRGSIWTPSHPLR